jgi:uncharacterized protein (DUF4213/DUF364 family)
MWEIYDALIDGIPGDLTVDSLVVGNTNAIVVSNGAAGVSSVLPYETRLPVSVGSLLGAPLRQAAALIKSWNMPEAAIGHAAMNAYYNSPAVAQRNGIIIPESAHREDRLNDPFITAQNEVKGKKVAVVGHFPYLETFFEPICSLSIIEWEPEESGDYPYEACEYLLPESDYVFITCRSLINKSFPRLLALSKNAVKTVLVGPATPMAPYLLTLGLADLSGFIIQDAARALRIVSGAESGKVSRCGHKVSLKK